MAVVAPLTVTGTGSGGAGIVTADLATVPCASCAKAAPVQAASKKTLVDRRQRTCDISHSPGDQRTSENYHLARRVSLGLGSSMSAKSRHLNALGRCLLLGVKRTSVKLQCLLMTQSGH